MVSEVVPRHKGKIAYLIFIRISHNKLFTISSNILNVFDRNDTGLQASLLALPLSVDWRTKGRVTSIKDQGGCACCWSFAAAGALEALTAKKTNKLFDISNQNLIDCTYGGIYLNLGCDGGWPYRAFDYVKVNNFFKPKNTSP
jgi:C1A family cysteine protease